MWVLRNGNNSEKRENERTVQSVVVTSPACTRSGWVHSLGGGVASAPFHRSWITVMYQRLTG